MEHLQSVFDRPRSSFKELDDNISLQETMY